MARSKKLKSSSANLPVPQDDSEMRAAIREIGEHQRAVERLQAEMNDKVAKIKQEYGDRAAPHTERAKSLYEGVHIFADANRERLTHGGKVKHHRYATGEISWRNRPAKVSTRGVEEIIEEIKRQGLEEEFLRIEEKIDKEAMLKNRDAALAIPGVSIGSEGEDFIVEPYETELKEAS